MNMKKMRDCLRKDDEKIFGVRDGRRQRLCHTEEETAEGHKSIKLHTIQVEKKRMFPQRS